MPLLQLTLEQVDSTHRMARRLLPELHSGWLVIEAIKQTQGRGQLNREWVSDTGGLYLTVVAPDWGVESVAVAHAVCRVAIPRGITPYVEWPNDLIVGHKKWGGILIETMQHPRNGTRYAMIGIGLNLNQVTFPSHLRATAVSYYQSRGSMTDVREWGQAIIKEIVCLYEESEGHPSSPKTPPKRF